MEGVAAAASIITILEVSGKLLARIREIANAANGTPQYLRHVENKLAVLKSVSKQVELQRVNGSIKAELMCGVEPLLEESSQMIRALESAVLKLIPTAHSDAWTRAKKSC